MILIINLKDWNLYLFTCKNKEPKFAASTNKDENVERQMSGRVIGYGYLIFSDGFGVRLEIFLQILRHIMTVTLLLALPLKLPHRNKDKETNVTLPGVTREDTPRRILL